MPGTVDPDEARRVAEVRFQEELERVLRQASLGLAILDGPAPSEKYVNRLTLQQVLSILARTVSHPDRRSVDLVLRICDEQCRCRRSPLGGMASALLIFPISLVAAFYFGRLRGANLKVGAWWVALVVELGIIAVMIRPVVACFRYREKDRSESTAIRLAAAYSLKRLASSYSGEFLDLDKSEREVGAGLHELSLEGYEAAWEKILSKARPSGRSGFPDL